MIVKKLKKKSVIKKSSLGMMSPKASVKKAVKPKKPFTGYRPYVLTRHPSHDPLRTQLQKLPFRSVVRLGSTTVLTDGKQRVECNSVQGVKNSSSKLLMKQCFTRAGVKTADWWVMNYMGNNHQINGISSKNIIGESQLSDLPYPIIAKSHYGSRGEGNSLIENVDEMKTFLKTRTPSNYIFEKYYSYNKEYRIHVTKEGCFYTCRKMLKRDTPEEKKFQRHDDNCVWILEENPQFDKPVNWNIIVGDCVKALNALGLDICCFDVKTQSSKDKRGNTRENPEYIIIESGSAPSFGDKTLIKYLQQIPRVLLSKRNGQ